MSFYLPFHLVSIFEAQLTPWYSDCMKNRRKMPQARILFSLVPPIRTGNSKIPIFNSSQDLSLILLSNNEKCVTFLPPQLRCPDFVSVSRISPLFPTSDPFNLRIENSVNIVTVSSVLKQFIARCYLHLLWYFSLLHT